jgi:hypothetical protein
MKKSELKQIIKEEIDKALSENVEMNKMNQMFNDKAGVKPSTAKNVMKYETLPGYSELPELVDDIDYNNRKSILLPSLYDSNESSRLYVKENVKDWIDKFKKMYKENPQFKVEGTKIKVLNLKEPDFAAMKDFGKLD